MTNQALVEQCARTTNPVSGACSGPPATFPGRHDKLAAVDAQTPVQHIQTCTICLATMVQCWRGTCEPASDTVSRYLELVVDNATQSLARGLRPIDREEARQDVTLQIIRAAELNDSWSPDKIAGKDNHQAWIRNAVKNKYFTWYERNVTNNHDQLTIDGHVADEHADGDWDNAGADGLAPAANTVVIPPLMDYDGAHGRDPGELVTNALQHVLISPDQRVWVDNILNVLRGRLAELSRDGDDEKVVFFVGWLRYLAESKGTGTLTDYSKQCGVSKATGSRNNAAVMEQLAQIFTEDPSLSGETRAHILEFLHITSQTGRTIQLNDHEARR